MTAMLQEQAQLRTYGPLRVDPTLLGVCREQLAAMATLSTDECDMHLARRDALIQKIDTAQADNLRLLVSAIGRLLDERASDG